MTNQSNYQKPNLFTKKQDILDAMNNGAILHKTHGIYSYWHLTFSDGTRYVSFRKDATYGISSRMKNVEIIEQSKKSISYKMITIKN
jgi:hypothetical protein